MKNIDTEVQNFHQKMAKSMHSLLKAFTEGFEAMDKAKEAELKSMVENRQVKRVQKLDKLHSGISNLEALTSKLKMSFDGDDKEKQDNNEAIQTKEEDPTPTDQTFLNSKIKDSK